MKYIDYFKNLYKNFKANRKHILIALIIMCMLLVLKTLMFLKNVSKDMNISSYELYIHPDGEYGILGRLSWVFPIIPIYSFVIIVLFNSLSNKYIVYRYKDRKNIWVQKFIYVITSSLIFSCLLFICGYIVGGVLTGNFKNNWTSINSYVYKSFNGTVDFTRIPKYFLSYKLILIAFLGSMLGLCTYGLLISILKLYLKNIYVYTIIITLVLFEALNSKFSIVLMQILLNFKLLIKPKIILINYTYLLILNVVLFLIGYYLIEYKDFI